jgi:hypothetical protein
VIDSEAVEELLPLTLPEVRRLLQWVLGRGEPARQRRLEWSFWRRRHQARAKRCHYRRRLAFLAAKVRL